MRQVHRRPPADASRYAVMAIRTRVRETGRMSEQLPDTRVLASLLGDVRVRRRGCTWPCSRALPRRARARWPGARRGRRSWRLPEMDPGELREVYLAVAVLENLRQAPPFAPLRRWRRRQCARRRATAPAIAADYDFHQPPTRGCGKRRAADGPDHARASAPTCSAPSASSAQHDEIIAAVEAGEHGRPPSWCARTSPARCRTSRRSSTTTTPRNPAGSINRPPDPRRLHEPVTDVVRQKYAASFDKATCRCRPARRSRLSPAWTRG